MEELRDKFERRIDYLRVSVTDRCNLRCIYCMPGYGILRKDPREILAFEEISKVIKICITLGINKIKITGGEPLARKDLPRLVGQLSSLSGLKDLSLTTNGVFLKERARLLKEFGLKKINISIDSLNDAKFKRITRCGALSDCLAGIDAALKEGFLVKLNVVVMKRINDDEILDFARFSKERKIIVRFIEFMPVSENNVSGQDLYVSCDEIKERLMVLGVFTRISSAGIGNGPAEYYKIGNSIIAGFISPLSCPFCSNCNRLRLTADGLLMPCLVSNDAFDLKKVLRQNEGEDSAADLIKKAAMRKPAGHNIRVSKNNQNIAMSQIGG